ncbi:MAG: RNA polymerase sigma factor [Bacteriovoracaceae bacterium]|nr:RNA polymerase sigma factor [Bacteriovoracaceae bacterium]
MIENLKEVYLLYHKNILALSYHYIGNVQEAEEITQEVFVKYSKVLRSNDEIPHIKAWLYRVTINLCLDQKRHYKVAIKYVKNLISRGEVVDNAYNKFELNETIKELLKDLDEKSKMILILRYLEDMDYGQISELMDTPIGTLKSICNRAKLKIKKDMRDE